MSDLPEDMGGGVVTPVKVRVEAVADPAPGVPAEVKVVKEKEGTVTFFDKVKAYYHTVITVVGAILAFVAQVSPILDFLPPTGKNYVTAGILFLTALLNFLKSNEVWVQKL